MHTKKYTEIYDIFINMEWYKNLSINLANLIVKLSGYIDKHHEIFNLIQGIKDKNYAHQYILECIAEILFNDTGDTKYISYISENRQYRIDISRYVRGKQGILYCADNNFFTAGLVSLTSFILENKYLLPSVKIFFTIDKTISEKNINKIKILCQQFNVDYEIIDAENILDSTNLKVEYGIFSSGKILAASAYYRIYAIKYILNAHNLDKLLYVDCDTLFVSDIYDLFSIDTKYPLIAKTDLPSPPVVHSKKINNIQNYFNSGVLLLNMQHEQIAYFINNAIKNISSYNNLIMHDQCALNIAFDGNYKELDDKYNFYLFPWAEVPIKNAKILHLLDSPKPWDSIYRYNIKITEQWFKIKNILETLIYTNDQ